jgi:hypothetical protein
MRKHRKKDRVKQLQNVAQQIVEAHFSGSVSDEDNNQRDTEQSRSEEAENCINLNTFTEGIALQDQQTQEEETEKRESHYQGEAVEKEQMKRWRKETEQDEYCDSGENIHIEGSEGGLQLPTEESELVEQEAQQINQTELQHDPFDQEEEDEESNQEQKRQNQYHFNYNHQYTPCYERAYSHKDDTIHEELLRMLTLFVKGQLTQTTFSNILQTQKKTLMSNPNTNPQLIKMMNLRSLYNYFQLGAVFKKIYYCPNCNEVSRNYPRICHCNCMMTEFGFMRSIREYITSLPQNICDICQRYQRQEIRSNVVGDVQTGEIYRYVMNNIRRTNSKLPLEAYAVALNEDRKSVV